MPQPPSILFRSLRSLFLAGLSLSVLMTAGCSDDESDSFPWASDETIELDIADSENPFATSDQKIMPFPSSFFTVEDSRSETGLRLSYPEDTLQSPVAAVRIDMNSLNRADGFSPTSTALVHFGVDIDPAQLSGQYELEESLDDGNPIAMFDLDTGKRILLLTEMDQNRKASHPGRYALIIRPMEPLEFGHRHLVLLTKDLRDVNGNELPSPEAFRALRDRIRTNSQRVEDVRSKFEGLFAFAAEKGYDRENLLLAWDFTVASLKYVTGPVGKMREMALAEMEGRGLGFTITRIRDNPNEFVAKVVEGTFEVPNFLNDKYEVEYDADRNPIRQGTDWYTFGMIIPKSAEEGPVSLTMFGHGLFGSGKDYLAGWGTRRFGEVANAGRALMVGTDWIGLSESDLPLIIDQVLPDINRIGLVTDRLMQSLINNLTLQELTIGQLAVHPDLQVGSHPLIDPEKVYYYGVSLGGIQGASFMSVTQRIQKGVLAVPGSSWITMLTRSTNWNRIKPVAENYYPDPIEQQLLYSFIQGRFDHSDPINLTRHLVKQPFPGSVPNKVVLLQEAIGDSQVPNISTRMLARAIGANLMYPFNEFVPRLRQVSSPTSESVVCQFYIPDRVTTNPPPQVNIPPRSDNGVHDAIHDLSTVIPQIFSFLNTGEVAQTCDGPCDPD